MLVLGGGSIKRFGFVDKAISYLKESGIETEIFDGVEPDPLADFNITPDIAIIDPALAETMPKQLVAHTGMDALTHAIEAYVGIAGNKKEAVEWLCDKIVEMNNYLGIPNTLKEFGIREDVNF